MSRPLIVTPEDRRHLREHWRLAGLSSVTIAALGAVLDYSDAATLTSWVGLRRIAADLGYRDKSALYRPLRDAEAAGQLVTYPAGNGQRARRQLIHPSDAPTPGCRACGLEHLEVMRDLAAYGLGPDAPAFTESDRALSQVVDNDRSNEQSGRATRPLSQQTGRVARPEVVVRAETSTSGESECPWDEPDDDLIVRPRQLEETERDEDDDPEPDAVRERVAWEAWLMRTVAPNIVRNQRARDERRQSG